MQVCKCPLCKTEMTDPVDWASASDVESLRAMTLHPGWDIYQNILRWQYAGAVAELVNGDGDARVQLTRQMKCRELGKRLLFEAGLPEAAESAGKGEAGRVPFARIMQAALGDEG